VSEACVCRGMVGDRALTGQGSDVGIFGEAEAVRLEGGMGAHGGPWRHGGHVGSLEAVVLVFWNHGEATWTAGASTGTWSGRAPARARGRHLKT
jgi:hypothetical protein